MWVKIENGKVVYPPVNADNMSNVYKNAAWLEAHGFTDMPMSEIAKYNEHKTKDYTAFREACKQFKAVCKNIGKLIGQEDFRGGFDEMAVFEQSEASKSADGIALAVAWVAADKLCTYEAGKLGIGQPEWWYRCWGIRKTEGGA